MISSTSGSSSSACSGPRPERALGHPADELGARAGVQQRRLALHERRDPRFRRAAAGGRSTSRSRSVAARRSSASLIAAPPPPRSGRGRPSSPGRARQQPELAREGLRGGQVDRLAKRRPAAWRRPVAPPVGVLRRSRREHLDVLQRQACPGSLARHEHVDARARGDELGEPDGDDLDRALAAAHAGAERPSATVSAAAVTYAPRGMRTAGIAPATSPGAAAAPTGAQRAGTSRASTSPKRTVSPARQVGARDEHRHERRQPRVQRRLAAAHVGRGERAEHQRQPDQQQPATPPAHPSPPRSRTGSSSDDGGAGGARRAEQAAAVALGDVGRDREPVPARTARAAGQRRSAAPAGPARRRGPRAAAARRPLAPAARPAPSPCSSALASRLPIACASRVRSTSSSAGRRRAPPTRTPSTRQAARSARAGRDRRRPPAGPAPALRWRGSQVVDREPRALQLQVERRVRPAARPRPRPTMSSSSSSATRQRPADLVATPAPPAAARATSRGGSAA